MNYTTIGVDVSKGKLDIFFSSTGEYLKVTNDVTGFKQFLQVIHKHYKDIIIKHIVVEHTGAYQKAFVAFSHKHNLPVSVVQPARVRNYAKMIGKLAKTDKIDAELLAQFGESQNPEVTPIEDSDIMRIRELLKYRRGLIEELKLTKNYQEKNPPIEVFKKWEKLEKQFNKMIREIELEILAFIKSNEQLHKKYVRLLETKGVGFCTAATLIAELPELGHYSKPKISALCGVVPLNRDSGTMRGKACIQGGRKVVRNALYMAVVSGIKCNDVIYSYYDHLKEKGKPTKIALVACMHKLITHLNVELKNV